VEEKCPRCKEEAINLFGLGTEKIEEEVKNLFPRARVRRLDSDVTSKKNAVSSILTGFRNRRIDILIGTQAVAKGLDFPCVTLIGVILADGSLNVPDFRAGERTFQLLTQVAGRSGRGKGTGLCLIQTYNPENYVITSSAAHAYAAFYEEEIKFRQELHYPPFCRFIRWLIRGKIEAGVKEAAERLARDIGDRAPQGTFLMGPSQAPLARIKGKYRWQFCLKTKEISRIRKIIREVMEEESKFLKGVEIIIDADPLDMF
jgi:primosomal protein N' (replication factor Y)